jgi:hypothetical protein
MHSVHLRQEPGSRSDRLVILVALGGLVAALAIGLHLTSLPHREMPAPLPQYPSPAHPAADAPAARVVVPPPAFDLVRISAAGDAVIAGRAAPGTTLEILADDQVIGQITADARGEWVFVPEQPLARGTHRLSLRTPGSPAGAATTITIPATR